SPRTRRGSDRDPHSCSHCYLRPVATFDDRVTIATPEGIELELVLAGVGSRFAASLLDVAVQLGAIFALAVVLGPLGSNGGVISILVTGRNQRLGDLAAGTLVVRERRPAVPAAATYVAPPPAAAPFLEWDVSGVSVEDIATLRQFLERRVSLSPGARAHLATALGIDLKPLRVGGAGMLAVAAVRPWLPSTLGPPCPLRTVTGIPCPFCGMTRGVTALVHGQLSNAFWFNPGAFLVVAMAIVLV